jgi:predicted nucleic acid-binding protein
MRDFFMRLAVRFVFQPKWTGEIHEEWIEAVLRNRPDLTRAQLTRTRELMNRFGNDWRVPPYRHLIPALVLPDPDDRHVLAAAIAAKAPVLVTLNTGDFPEATLSGYGVRAVPPDAFACELREAEPERFLRAVREHRAGLKNPPKTVPEYLSSLEACGLPRTAHLLRGDEDAL